MKNINAKKRKIMIMLSLVLSFILALSGCDLLDDEDYDDEYGYDEDYDSLFDDGEQADAKYQTDDEYGDGTATILMYFVGSDLESDGGCATADIQEICNAECENVNIVIQTGGTKYWQNSFMSDGEVQRFIVENGEIQHIEDLGRTSMLTTENLSDFIEWGCSNYPADTMGFIFWDHGGGTLCGFGEDELYPQDSLELSDLASAFNDAGYHFDFIGFDACLMGTIETAYALKPYADYLIASEETEPGTGWYYTNMLTSLSKNPTASIPSFGSKIIKDFVNGPDASFFDSNTLAVYDLSKVEKLQDELFEYFEEKQDSITGSGYQKVAAARSKAKAYGDGEFDQVDIIDFLTYAGVSKDDELYKAVEDVVVCFDTNIGHSNGIAMYFPYDYPDYYEQMIYEFSETGYADATYTGFFNSFLSVMCNSTVEASVSPISNLTGYDTDTDNFDYEESEWYDSTAVTTDTGLGFVLNEDGELYLEESDDGFILEMTDDQWEYIDYIDLQVIVDDGEGYMELGCDNVYSLDDNDNLLVDFDYQWVALDGQIVCFYAEDEGEKNDGSTYSYGYVPAEVEYADGRGTAEIEIIVYWDSDHEEGYVSGYRYMSEDGPSMYSRNLMQFSVGDKISFLCDYYTYDGDYDACYYFGEIIEYDGSLTVSYEELEDCTTLIYYYIRDIFQNEYYTETIELSM